MQTRRVQAGGVGLEVAEAGTGGRPFLLVHGFTGAKEDLSECLDLLAERGWHAVAPDLRGHGASDHPSGDDSYSLATYVGDVLALVDALGWSHFAVLGYSMGGMVVQELVLAHPDRVDALVLMDTSHGVPDGLDPETIELGASIVRDHGMATLLAVQNERRHHRPATVAERRLLRERPGWEEFGARKLLESSPDMWVAMTREIIRQSDRLEALEQLRMPVLVIVGEHDRSFVTHCERMAKAIPGARLARIPGAGHSPQFENATAWWDALAAFLDDLPS